LGTAWKAVPGILPHVAGTYHHIRKAVIIYYHIRKAVIIYYHIRQVIEAAETCAV